MDNHMGGDLPAAAKAIEENIEEKERFELDRKGVEDVVTENEKRQSAGSSSESASDSGPEDLHKYDSQIVKIRDVPEGDAALAHLPEHEQAVLKRQLDNPSVSVSWLMLYRYATTWDKVIVGISIFCAIGAGAAMPLMTVSLLSSISQMRIHSLT
jgi:ATP-binding cassette subfamily B (MDR/TAP) protein 1